MDGQEIEAPLVDNRRCSHVEDTREKENTGGQHSQKLEADRGRNAAKGIQHRIVARHGSLKFGLGKVWPRKGMVQTFLPQARRRKPRRSSYGAFSSQKTHEAKFTGPSPPRLRAGPTPGPFFWGASAGGFVVFLQEGRRNASIYAKSGVTRGASV